MTELYSVDGKVCELIDARLKFQGLKAIGVTLRFHESEPVRNLSLPMSPTIETFTKYWCFPNPTMVKENVVTPSTKLQALGELGIKAHLERYV